MTNYVQNNTARVRIGYTWGGEKHKVQFRHKAAITHAAFAALIRTAIDANKAVLTSSLTFDQAEAADAGSDTFSILSFTPVVGTGSPYANDVNSNASRGLEILGRSTGGSNCSWTFYGQPFTTNKPKRFSIPATGLINGVNDIIAELISASGSPLCGIDGTSIVQRAYVNIIENDYLTRKYRQ